MLKYKDAQVTFREVPDEICLCIELANCPFRCEGCHSPELREDIGEELTSEVLDKLIMDNPGITCIAFMGGDANLEELIVMAAHVHDAWHGMKVAWYTGRELPVEAECMDGGGLVRAKLPAQMDQKHLDYVKFGPYDASAGPLDKETTNQRMICNVHMLSDGNTLVGEDITWKFWVKSWK